LIGIIGVPGDRRDDQIIHSGQVAATGFDELYIREDHDLRGRDPEETAKLLYTGARRAGMPASNLHVIPEILCALDESLRRAKPGDVVVVFYEEIRPVLDYLRNQERIEKNAAVKQTVQG
jgi:cyanophycin synthetase